MTGSAAPQRPSLILNNLHYSGASALVPVLADVLPAAGYEVLPLDVTAGLQRLEQRTDPERPFFYWGHDRPGVYGEMIGDPRYRFVYLHRDPRDVLVSWANDRLARGLDEAPMAQVLRFLIDSPNGLPSRLIEALEWRLKAKDTRIVTFERATLDTRRCVQEILGDLGLTDLPNGLLDAALERWSFERVTGRRRGEPGPMTRTQYLFRNGTSGQWRELFDEELKRVFHDRFGRTLELLGWERAPVPG